MPSIIKAMMVARKRAIKAANLSLGLLAGMKSRQYMSDKDYRALYESTYEVRNKIGVHIQELRDRFNLGID